MAFSPSKEQLQVYKAVKGSQDVCVEATAGGGKTTTLLEILKLLPRTKKIVFLSFSNTIVNELKERVPGHVLASTLHSLGCKMTMRSLSGGKRRINIDQNKYMKKLVKLFSKEDLSGDKRKETFTMIYECVAMYNYMRMTLTKNDQASILAMSEYYGIAASEKHVQLLQTMIGEMSEAMDSIDFSDMIYLPATKSYIVDVRYDYVLVDEAQDLNNCQRLFLEKILAPGGKMIAVGDSNQSIYSFSGANIDSFKVLQNRKNTVTLPLSVTYRCGYNIVKKAQEVWGEEAIKPFEGAKPGVVRKGSVKEIKSDDIVLSRYTAPLVRLFFELISLNVPSSIVGKDYEKGLLDFAKDCASDTREGVLYKLNLGRKQLVEKLAEKGINSPTFHQSYIDYDEKSKIILCILNNGTKPRQIIHKIQSMFDESVKGARLMTIHRSKGLENKRVFCIEYYDAKRILPDFSKSTYEWHKIQEKNLQFVAYTRAQDELIFLNLFSEGEIERQMTILDVLQPGRLNVGDNN